MIRVCVVDDQTLVRQGIRALLQLTQNQIEVVAEAADGEEALEEIAKTQPDVVLLDIRMPRMGGIEVLQELKQTHQPPACILLTTFNDDTALFEGMRAGARGFLLKDVSLEQLQEAIVTVAKGGTLLQPTITEYVLRHISGQANQAVDPNMYSALTTKETEILRLMSGGYSNREIADGMGLSEGTIKNHVSHVLDKLNVHDRTRAVLKALDLGIIGKPEKP